MKDGSTSWSIVSWKEKFWGRFNIVCRSWGVTPSSPNQWGWANSWGIVQKNVWGRNLWELVSAFKNIDSTFTFLLTNNGRTDGYRINTASYYFTSFAFLPLLSAAKTVGNFPEPGNIVNLSSISGITKTSQRGQFSYNANKWVHLPWYNIQVVSADLGH